MAKKLSVLLGLTACLTLSSCAKSLLLGMIHFSPKKDSPQNTSAVSTPTPTPPRVIPPLRTTMILSCKEVDSARFKNPSLYTSYRRSPVAFSYEGEIREAPGLLIIIAVYRDLTREDIIPKDLDIKIHSVEDVVREILILPFRMFFSPIQKTNLTIEVEDYTFSIRAALSDKPYLFIPKKDLYWDKKKQATWKNSSNDFNCQLSEENLKLCQSALDYKMTILNGVAIKDLKDPEAEQVKCVSEILKTTRQEIAVHMDEPTEGYDASKESQNNSGSLP